MPLFNVTSILTSQLVFLLRRGQCERRNRYLDQFTYSRYFRNFLTHTNTHFFFLKLSCLQSTPSIFNRGSLFIGFICGTLTKTGRKHTVCLGRHNEEQQRGQRVRGKKNSPERAKVTFQSSKRRDVSIDVKTFILFLYSVWSTFQVNLLLVSNNILLTNSFWGNLGYTALQCGAY